jgi:hypothetical protein
MLPNTAQPDTAEEKLDARLSELLHQMSKQHQDQHQG